MWMILKRDSAKKIDFAIDWSKHYILLVSRCHHWMWVAMFKLHTAYLLQVMRSTCYSSPHNVLLWLVGFQQLWLVHFVFNRMNNQSLILFHTYTLLCQGKAHKEHFHAAKCSDIWAGSLYLAPMDLADMMGGCGTILQEQALAVRWHSLSGEGKNVAVLSLVNDDKAFKKHLRRMVN